MSIDFSQITAITIPEGNVIEIKDSANNILWQQKSDGEYLFSMSFNATTFQTDPTGCLTYTDDCVGYTPVSGPGSSLATCSTLGSWDMNSDGTSDNPLLNKCFYATFTSSGILHQKLNPKNLSQYIATWDDTNKEWVPGSGSSSITSENTMFCIPTLYENSDSTSISISDGSSNGKAYAHTIEGHTYQYLALGVYEGYVDSSKLMSISGVASTGSTRRPNFRTYAGNNTVSNGHAMIWNFYQWNLWRKLTIFAMKSFNGQTQIGQGGFTYNGGVGQGLCNAMGLFAGSTSTTASTSTSVKAFIENPWGYKQEFIDDFVNISHVFYAGQNAVPDDTSSNKTNLGSSFLGGGDFASAISTAPRSWGLCTATGGSKSTGLCDTQSLNSTGSCCGCVGGHSSYVSGGNAGPSYLIANIGFFLSGTSRGARLAFVFDL